MASSTASSSPTSSASTTSIGGSADAAIAAGVQVPLIDPSLLIPAMAAVTTHLGFGVTANLTCEQPFVFARRMSSLDQLTNGRIAWNVVTGYLDSAARAIGMSGQTAHDDRYDLADEYMALVRALWERSWDDDAVLADRASGRYADPARVRAIHHEGPQYRVDAMHLVAPTPQRTPLIFQAGASTRGRRFAATHAECVFVNGGKPDAIDALVTDIRAQAEALGRGPDAIKVFLGATIVTGRTDKEARDKLEDYRRHVDIDAALAHASASMGIDLAKYDLDEPIETGKSQAIVSNVEAMTRAAGPQWTKRKLIDQLILGSRQAPMVGSAEEHRRPADRLEREARHRRLQPVAHRRAGMLWRRRGDWWCRCCRSAGRSRRGTRRGRIGRSCSGTRGCRPGMRGRGLRTNRRGRRRMMRGRRPHSSSARAPTFVILARSAGIHAATCPAVDTPEDGGPFLRRSGGCPVAAWVPGLRPRMTKRRGGVRFVIPARPLSSSSRAARGSMPRRVLLSIRRRTVALPATQRGLPGRGMGPRPAAEDDEAEGDAPS